MVWREFTAHLTPNTFAFVVRNLGGDYVDATGDVRDHLAPGRFLSTYGIFYPEGDDLLYEAKQIAFASDALASVMGVGRARGERPQTDRCRRDRATPSRHARHRRCSGESPPTP